MAALVSLDIKEKQILARYDDDANFTWHHRVLLRKLGPTDWVALTPDLDVQLLNVGTTRFLPLLRNRPIPANAVGDSYLFDPITARELSDAHQQARQYGDILGDAAADEDEEVWVVGDSMHPRFGDVIDAAVLADEARSTLRVSLGVVQLEEDDDETEVVVEKVPKKELEAWKKSKGGGGDLRLIGTFRNAAGKRFCSCKEAIEMQVETKFEDFPFDEPRAAREYLVGVLESTDGSFDTYHQTWVASSGVAPSSAIAHDHRILLEALRIGLTYDQLNLANSAMAEQIVRRLVQHEMAVEKDSKHPDYSGLGSMLAGALDERGRLAVPKFTKHLAERQQQRAQILKQTRLLREEKATEQKRRKGKGKGLTAEGGAASA
jgi:hypothetical protein